MPEDQGNPDAALSNEVVRALGQELRRLREEHAAVEERNDVLEEENTRLQRELDDTRRARQASRKPGVKEEESGILLSGNDYDQVKRALEESMQQRETEQAEHAQVVEGLRNKLARGKERRAALRAAFSETREFDVKALLRCDELDVLDPSDLRGLTVAPNSPPMDVWLRKLGKTLDESRYHDCVWKCWPDDSLWATSKDFCVSLLPSHIYNTGTGSFKRNPQEFLPRLGDTRDLFHFHRDACHNWLYCGSFKCEWSCSVSLADLDNFTKATPSTIARLNDDDELCIYMPLQAISNGAKTRRAPVRLVAVRTPLSTLSMYYVGIARLKKTIVDKACAGGGPASRTAADKMLEDGSMTVGCYCLVKTGYRYQVDLAMEAYTRDHDKKSQSQTRKRPSDDASTGNKNSKKKRKQ